MTIEILKGTTTIGGALTTITTSKGTKIELDMGLDLDDILRLPEIDGLNTGEPTYSRSMYQSLSRRPLRTN